MEIRESFAVLLKSTGQESQQDISSISQGVGYQLENSVSWEQKASSEGPLTVRDRIIWRSAYPQWGIESKTCPSQQQAELSEDPPTYGMGLLLAVG